MKQIRLINVPLIAFICLLMSVNTVSADGIEIVPEPIPQHLLPLFDRYAGTWEGVYILEGIGSNFRQELFGRFIYNWSDLDGVSLLIVESLYTSEDAPLISAAGVMFYANGKLYMDMERHDGSVELRVGTVSDDLQTVTWQQANESTVINRRFIETHVREADGSWRMDLKSHQDMTDRGMDMLLYLHGIAYKVGS